MMDQRKIIQSVISQINSAKSDIENFPRNGLNKKSITELDLVYNALNDSINHCNAIFGPTTLKDLDV